MRCNQQEKDLGPLDSALSLDESACGRYSSYKPQPSQPSGVGYRRRISEEAKPLPHATQVEAGSSQSVPHPDHQAEASAANTVQARHVSMPAQAAVSGTISSHENKPRRIQPEQVLLPWHCFPVSGLMADGDSLRNHTEAALVLCQNLKSESLLCFWRAFPGHRYHEIAIESHSQHDFP